jgi:DNA-binding CsgD family transcriptional regulator
MKRDWWELLRTGRLNGDGELIRGDGRRVRVQFAAHREVVTGRDLILGVVLELDGRPMRCGEASVDASPRALTGREREVVALVALGRRRREIAAQLFISDATVKTHLRNAMHKLDVHSQAQLVAVALTRGLIELEQHPAAEGSGSTRKPHGGALRGRGRPTPGPVDHTDPHPVCQRGRLGTRPALSTKERADEVVMASDDAGAHRPIGVFAPPTARLSVTSLPSSTRGVTLIKYEVS